ncbi:hypothetical protein BH10PAT1_BH10PAT1_3530 [soil metagenome]
MTKKKQVAKKITLILSIGIIFLSIPVTFYVYFLNKAYPGVLINSVKVEGKSKNEIVSILSSTTLPDSNITLTYNDKAFQIPVNSLNLSYNFDQSAKKALILGRSGNLAFDFGQIRNSLLYQKNYGLDFTLDEASLDNSIASISAQIATPGILPSFEIANNQLTINALGKSGSEIDSTKLISDIKKSFSFNNHNPIAISLKETSLKDQANKIADITAKKVNIPSQNAKFDIVGNKVQSFLPEKDGIEVDVTKLSNLIENALTTFSGNKISIDIPSSTIAAEIKTSDVNNLGIKELIGSGTSHFAGSIASRIYNVNLAASRIDNTLIAPDQVFSFDQTVGDISALSGYQQAYIIQNGQTILGDGGGVCQVSTTMFRAAMNTGLPIVERHAHAYQVHYYEEDAPPGLDATIYSPTVDFKFKNDTGNYILIQTQIDLKNLVLTFNLYGTSDGRIATISKPTLWDSKPAPDALYTDDPTLPVGVIKQIDFAATGLKSQFDYTVTKNNEVINKQTFFSNFQPWQAKFLRGTKI